jgi:hypothetical protein
VLLILPYLYYKKKHDMFPGIQKKIFMNSFPPSVEFLCACPEVPKHCLCLLGQFTNILQGLLRNQTHLDYYSKIVEELTADLGTANIMQCTTGRERDFRGPPVAPEEMWRGFRGPSTAQEERGLAFLAERS